MPNSEYKLREIRSIKTAIYLAATLMALPAHGQTRRENHAHPPAPPFAIQVRRNVVQVRVVVRDKHGKPIPSLTRKDFVLLDDGKPQVISSFSVENATTIAVPSLPAAQGSAKPVGAPPVIQARPTRFVALFFDDLNMKREEFIWLRRAAEHFLDTSLAPGDRVALFTTSGVGQVEFTDDRAKLRAALRGLQPRGFLRHQLTQCPPMTDYEAFLIAVLNDQQALQVAIQEVINCQCGGDAEACSDPESVARDAARSDWDEAESDFRYSIRGLSRMVERLETMPGPRTIVFISPGFNAWTFKQEIDDVINRALRNNIVINALDPRGLYSAIPGGGDASHQGFPLTGPLLATKDMLHSTSLLTDSAILEGLADATGGVWFHDNNDFNQGFREAGGLPPTSYVLSFSPSALKLNGKYHKLKVRLASDERHRGWTLQARKGYYAPSSAMATAQRVHQELKTAVYSQTHLAGLPIELETRWTRSNPSGWKLTVVTNLDARALHFETRAGRSADVVEFVAAVFDKNGNFLAGKQRKVALNLTDVVLKAVLARGFNVLMHFTLPPGTYMIRVVVRDSDGSMAAQTGIAASPS